MPENSLSKWMRKPGDVGERRSWILSWTADDGGICYHVMRKRSSRAESDPMRKKARPSTLTLKTIRQINLEMGLPTIGIDALIAAEEAGDDKLFALCLAALSELEMQAENLAVTKH